MMLYTSQAGEAPSGSWGRTDTIEGFLERVQHMPDVEAEQEILARKRAQAIETGRLQLELRRLDSERGVKGREARDIGYQLQAMTAENSILTSVLKELRARMERTRWSNAVRAVFGSDGWAQCREWMAAEEAASVGDIRSATSAQGGNDDSMDEAADRPRG